MFFLLAFLGIIYLIITRKSNSMSKEITHSHNYMEK